MDAVEPAKKKLREAIDGLRADIDRVEFWADALDGLAQPVPEYHASDRLSQHLLSPGPRSSGHSATHDGRKRLADARR
jgi:hypothetical protein